MGFARTKVKLKVMLVCFSAGTIKDRTEMNLCVYETHIPKDTSEIIVENIRQNRLKRVKNFFPKITVARIFCVFYSVLQYRVKYNLRTQIIPLYSATVMLRIVRFTACAVLSTTCCYGEHTNGHEIGEHEARMWGTRNANSFSRKIWRKMITWKTYA
jgi:hypothetical protein